METSADLEFTREYYNKPIKHGVVPLNENIFTIYTKTLLHAKVAMQNQKLKSYLLKSSKNFDVENTKINDDEILE